MKTFQVFLIYTIGLFFVAMFLSQTYIAGQHHRIPWMERECR